MYVSNKTQIQHLVHAGRRMKSLSPKRSFKKKMKSNLSQNHHISLAGWGLVQGCLPSPYERAAAERLRACPWGPWLTQGGKLLTSLLERREGAVHFFLPCAAGSSKQLSYILAASSTRQPALAVSVGWVLLLLEEYRRHRSNLCSPCNKNYPPGLQRLPEPFVRMSSI